MEKQGVDLVISFDTTGSMYPCLAQLRQHVSDAVKRLFKQVPHLRIGIIAHGDYCDAGSTYVTKVFDLSSKEDEIVSFVKKVGPTGGGDSPECYELVLNEARALTWTAGKSKVLVMIGDDVPHGPEYSMNTKKLNWRNELDCLQEMGVSVYGVQALNRRHATNFYQEVAKKTGGFHLDLDQFSYVVDMILAIAFKQEGEAVLQNFEQELVKQKKMSRSMDKVFNTLSGRKETKSTRYSDAADLESVPAGRFQVLDVDELSVIKDFVQGFGIEFEKGRGFYQFTKRETIQPYKEIVLMDKASGDMFTGDKARSLLGLTSSENEDISPKNFDKYNVFVQSTSYNRKLMAGTKFLYEVKDYAR